MPIIYPEALPADAPVEEQLEAKLNQAALHFDAFNTQPFPKAETGFPNDPATEWSQQYGDLFQRLLFAGEAVRHHRYGRTDPYKLGHCYAIVQSAMSRLSRQRGRGQSSKLEALPSTPLRKTSQLTEYLAMLSRVRPLEAHFAEGDVFAEKAATGEIYLDEAA